MDIGRIVTRACLGILAVEAAWVAFLLIGGDPRFEIALDYRIYHDAAFRWLNGGGFYLPEQLNGAYTLRIGDVLYPPVILWLLAPLTVLPEQLWWLIPVALTAFAIWKLRPEPLALVLVTAICLWPHTPQAVIHGNPVMWAVAFASLAVAYGWPGPFVLIKPTLAPFALIGITRRAWWAGLAAFALLCVPFAGLWAQWLHVVLDSGGATYPFGDYATMLLPLAATVRVDTVRRLAGRVVRRPT